MTRCTLTAKAPWYISPAGSITVLYLWSGPLASAMIHDRRRHTHSHSHEPTHSNRDGRAGVGTGNKSCADQRVDARAALEQTRIPAGRRQAPGAHLARDGSPASRLTVSVHACLPGRRGWDAGQVVQGRDFENWRPEAQFDGKIHIAGVDVGTHRHDLYHQPPRRHHDEVGQPGPVHRYHGGGAGEGEQL